MKNIRQFQIYSMRWRSTVTAHSPNVSAESPEDLEVNNEFVTAKHYNQVPGPTPWPIIGNTWRMLPVIGTVRYKQCIFRTKFLHFSVGPYQISDLANVSYILYKQYGKIAKLGNLVGRPDLLFVYDANEIEKVYRQEGDTPYRPSMPCLVKYKSQVRGQFFGKLPGVVGV